MRRQSVGSGTTSKADYLVCPGCGCGQLRPRGLPSRMSECGFCKCAFDDTLVGTLKQIAALPEALGKHPCECGHLEMRCLPDGVFHCPSCRSEVLPISIPKPRRIAEEMVGGIGANPGSARPPDEEGGVVAVV
jgi:hypothetical protein